MRYRIVHRPNNATLPFVSQFRFWLFFWENINYGETRAECDEQIKAHAAARARERSTVVWEGDLKP